jgi:hypothetical protein
MCQRPFRKEAVEFGCGQCMACRINRVREWVGRMSLELNEHPTACFVTLTYNQECVPANGELDKRHLQLFIKRLRDRMAPRRLRYYAVGEYGDQSWRPHYHLVVYNLSPTESADVEACWPYGFVMTGTAESSSMAYVAGYITKKMTNKKDGRLHGRAPEFCIMSRRPGLGHGAVTRIAKAMSSYPSEQSFDVREVRIGGKKYPLGRLLREKVQAACGLDVQTKARCKQASIDAVSVRSINLTASDYHRTRKARVDQQTYRRKKGDL